MWNISIDWFLCRTFWARKQWFQIYCSFLKTKIIKKSLFTVLGAFILFSCNQNTNNPKSQSDVSDSMSADTSLTLNDGAKWKSDSITNHNLIRLKVTANMFSVEPFPSQANYQVLSNDLANGVFCYFLFRFFLLGNTCWSSCR